MQTHIIENDVVVNTIVATIEEAQVAFPNATCIDASIGGSIGDKIVDGVVVPAIPEPTPSPVPDKVDRLQARLALIYAGKWSLIQPAIDAIPDPIQRAVAQAYFEDAKYWYRQDLFVLTLGPAIGLSDADMDALFIDAAGR